MGGLYLEVSLIYGVVFRTTEGLCKGGIGSQNGGQILGKIIRVEPACQSQVEEGRRIDCEQFAANGQLRGTRNTIPMRD